MLERVPEDYVPRPYSEDETREAFDSTIEYWRRWLAKSRYQGRWREMVHRSALTLKLLTYRPTGGIVAAPTTSLPEQLGGGRNWDYRYTWIRDAAFSLYALLRLGFTDEAAAFMDWLRERFREDRAGRARAAPDHVRDRRPLGAARRRCSTTSRATAGSAPVRIGNGAADQLQLDIYGELIDSVYFYNQYGSPIDHDAWVDLRRVDRLDLRELGPGRRGHLGGARRAQALHLLAAHVLGRRSSARCGSRSSAACPADLPQVAVVARPDLPPDHGQGLARGAPGVRPALRHRRASTRPCC